jgi:hypothetical protein
MANLTSDHSGNYIIRFSPRWARRHLVKLLRGFCPDAQGTVALSAGSAS